jgi:2-dehydro-3-deoxyphosphogluconate aldolase/(4S)-4-hydroxy-2-oxoglutarate aldolase
MTALERVQACGVVPVVVLDDASAAQSLGEALIAGGLPCAEITFRTAAAEHAIEVLARDERLTVGAGTILDPGQVDRAAAAGAQFVVSPGLDLDVVRRCRELDLPVIPGIATPTEAMSAVRAGLDTVKLFPAQVLGGLSLVTALAGPFPSLRFVPTGGIGPDELADYARHDAILAVGGSWIAPRALLATGALDEIAWRAAQARAIVDAARDAERASA